MVVEVGTLAPEFSLLTKTNKTIICRIILEKRFCFIFIQKMIHLVVRLKPVISEMTTVLIRKLVWLSSGSVPIHLRARQI